MVIDDLAVRSDRDWLFLCLAKISLRVHSQRFSEQGVMFSLRCHGFQRRSLFVRRCHRKEEQVVIHDALRVGVQRSGDRRAVVQVGCGNLLVCVAYIVKALL